MTNKIAAFLMLFVTACKEAERPRPPTRRALRPARGARS